mgnify:FL=1|tara:strand:+ start:75 stop:494 length:420 start_codon:yes stop_codon:yes gene_type:complete
MATINATVSIGSDIMSYATNISKTMTMKKAGTTTGLNLTTGLSSKRYTATTQVVLQTYNDVAVTSGGANKVYIRNTGSDKAEFFKVTLADATDAVEEIGRLYGGDWMLMPWEAASADHNIYVQPSTAEVMTLEFMIFFE